MELDFFTIGSEKLSHQKSDNNFEIVTLPKSSNPYGDFGEKDSNYSDRLRIITKLLKDRDLNQPNNAKRYIIIADIQDIINNIPSKEFFKNNYYCFKLGQTISSDEIVMILLDIGFTRSHIARNNGEFALKGEILDIVINNIGFRLNIVFDKINNIKRFDLLTQLSIKEDNDNSNFIEVYPFRDILNDSSINNFKKSFLQEFGMKGTDSLVYNEIINGKHNNYLRSLWPLLHNKFSNIIDFLDRPLLVLNQNTENYLNQIKNQYGLEYNKKRALVNDRSIDDSYNEFSNIDKPQEFLFLPSNFYLNNNMISLDEIAKQNNSSNKSILVIKNENNDYCKIINLSEKIKKTDIDNSKILNELYEVETEQKQNNDIIIDNIIKLTKEYKNKSIVIFCPDKNQLNIITNLISNTNLSHKNKSDLISINYITNIKDIKNSHNNKYYLNITNTPLLESLILDKYLFINSCEITGIKYLFNKTEVKKFTHLANSSYLKNSLQTNNKLEAILDSFDNIKKGDLIIHYKHGIGLFDGIEHIIHKNQCDFSKNLAKARGHDFLKIYYKDNDVFYLPVENINLIRKFSDKPEEYILDKLGSNKFAKRKALAKQEIQVIAKEIISISAKRKLLNNEYIDYSTIEYNRFCDEFPYIETEDQLRSMEDIKNDFKIGKLMDRLICGDVGFGKTEVAMRTSFMVCNSSNSINSSKNNTKNNGLLEKLNNQVVLIAPTTILASQHYRNFKDRFKNTDYNIVYLSRLVKMAEAKSVIEKINNGEADIIIGTHALLNDKIRFPNLKMVIIDEEQHFGVSQKEKLKKLKNNIHIMSMSATPIPRTMHMSMAGLKDLSIISTPPMDKKPIKTYLMPFNNLFIKEAIQKEKERGGKSFFVCPRIEHLSDISIFFDKELSNFKYEIIHGQMTPGKVDKLINEFYEGHFDILLSTTIIESGIDIKGANTIIVHHADMLGLSQLYQLRGRVGRSKEEAFAYLTFSKNKILPKKTMDKLEIMQDVNYPGASFKIAAHDMDIRGYGNLIGVKQSGNIKDIGVNLYNEMLAEEINKMQDLYKKAGNNDEEEINDIDINQKPSYVNKVENTDIMLKLNINIFIPEEYIANSSLRLEIYKRTGAITSYHEMELFKQEMVDRFGIVPREFINLMEIILIKFEAVKYGIKSIERGSKGFVIKISNQFIKNYLSTNNISNPKDPLTITSHNKKLSISQINNNDYRIFYKDNSNHNLSEEDIIARVKVILNEINKTLIFE
ncbi:MAG TPA: helicase-related protein [Candidatus Megaira endosymbiont of Hartmannula sinica]|nr:helicase-related protein [Candidatus Megaera endosymbiont of Hartmannula sinica]